MSQDPKSSKQSSGADFTKTIHHDTYDFVKPEQWDLTGRAVLITGASKGIGKDNAISFARAGASYIALGARSDMTDLKTAVLAAAKRAGRKQPEVLLFKLDVTSKDSVFAAINTISSTFKRLDVVINNAGYLEGRTAVAESDVDAWWRTYEVNTLGTYLVARYTIPLLKSSSDGLKTILNVASIGGHLLAPGGSSYGVTKFALLRFGEFINVEHAEDGILSYGVHPGAVPTELSSGLPECYHHVLVDKPELAADSFVWLTAKRREWLAGRYVSVTWDMEEFEGMRGKVEEGDLLKVRLDVGRD
ncbi:hypothetical protein LTR95_006243 [Oleoguttula sp. CCFEE 5521]